MLYDVMLIRQTHGRDIGVTETERRVHYVLLGTDQEG